MAGVQGLEASLTQVVDTGLADAEKLRRILRNAVAALSPPRAKAISKDLAKPMATLDIERLMRSAALQKRLRCIVLQALTVWNRNWDAEQICPMLSRLHFLIERFERGGQVARALAGQQWQQIKCAVCIAESGSESAQDVSSLVAPSDSSLKRKRSINQDVTIRGYKPVQAGVYTPNPNIRALRCVEEGLVSIVLRCLVCAREITSKCFFVFRGSRQVLRPHRACCKDGGKFVPVNPDTPSKVDKLNHLDICDHDRTREDCQQCSKRIACEHGKWSNHCSLCRAARVTARV